MPLQERSRPNQAEFTIEALHDSGKRLDLEIHDPNQSHFGVDFWWAVQDPKKTTTGGSGNGGKTLGELTSRLGDSIDDFLRASGNQRGKCEVKLRSPLPVITEALTQRGVLESLRNRFKDMLINVVTK